MLIFISMRSILLNKKIDDCFEFETPSKKTNEYQILDIGYYEDV
jgi:hypothetical protein